MKNTVRVCSGIYRGRELLVPASGTHPMGAREKIALFNMVDVAGATVLDAFAGSGALGIEALSLGARQATFVEKNPAAAKIIRENLKNLNVQNGEVITGDVAKISVGERFDVVIADPPYDNFDINTISCLTKLLKDGGILVLSHPNDAPNIAGLSLIKTRKYAAAHISIYR